MIESPATQSATVREANPTQIDAPSPYMRVSGTGAALVRSLLDLELGIAAGDLNTAISATLYLYKGDSWGAGTHNLTVAPIDDDWDASSIDWTAQSAGSFVRTPSVVFTVLASGSAGDEIAIDITTIVQAALAENNADGTRWRGLRLSVSSSGEKLLYSAFAEPDFRPYIEIEPAIAPDAPSNLQPSDGRVVGKQKPIFMADFTDDEADDYITAIHVQVDNVDDFVTPDYDSGWVAHDQPIFDSNSPPAGSAAFSNLTIGSTRFWRMQVRDRHNLESDWSEPAEFIVRTRAALAITAPTISGGTINSPTPTISFTFTPASTETKEWVWVLLERTVEDVWETHWEYPQQVSSVSSVTVPNENVLEHGTTYRITVRIGDSYEREDLPGDRMFHEAQSAEFELAAYT